MCSSPLNQLNTFKVFSHDSSPSSCHCLILLLFLSIFLFSLSGPAYSLIPWVFIGRTDVEAETPILWPPVTKSWLIWKDSDAGKDWEQEEKGMTEDEMAGWHHELDGHWFEWTLGVGDGQGGLACCDSLAHKESDATERLNWTELKSLLSIIFLFFQGYFLNL